jgi:arginine deiminase
MENATKINIKSEIGRLKCVILHTPGNELQNMTPANAQRALYSDILNLSVAQAEYAQFSGVLKKAAQVYELTDLLKQVVLNDRHRENLINQICTFEEVLEIRDYLLSLSADDLVKQLIEGVVLRKDSLTKFLSKEKYILQPLHNSFFTRDPAIAINERVLISQMANKVRKRESIIMEAIFSFHSSFMGKTVNPENTGICPKGATIEGGDLLVLRDNLFLVGSSARTSTQGIDYIINRLKERRLTRDIIVQELPLTPESFIHLDMTFTMLDKDCCMVYEPLILKPNRYQTIHIHIDDGEVKSIRTVDNIPAVLKELGMDLKPIMCGGTHDEWNQEREQWHSGANFFAIAPGKVIGYGRNVHTLEELNKAGFEIIRAKDIVSGAKNCDDYKKCVISIEGSELARGGGGARCMTMPVCREEVEW